MKEYLLSQIADLNLAVSATERELAALHEITTSTVTDHSDMDRQIQVLELKKAIAAAKFRAYSDILNRLTNSNLKQQTRKHGRPGIRSAEWRAVLQYMAAQWPQATSTDRLMGYILMANLNLNRQALRAQLTAYTHKGCLERNAEGVYRITSKGLKEANIEL
jgi:hypothetical protein